MTGPLVRLQHHAQIQDARSRELAQALPRPARVRLSVRTVGIGESRLVGRHGVSFGAFMLEEPTFTFGVQCLETLAKGELPLATAMVLGYRRNANGLYLGADMGFRIESSRFNIRLNFSLTFEGSTLRSTAGTQATLPTARGANTFTGPVVNDSDDVT